MLHKALSHILATEEHDPAPWLENLVLQEEHSRVRVIFPHKYFSLWFQQHKQKNFEAAVRRHFSQNTQLAPGASDIQIIYETRHYPGKAQAISPSQPAAGFKNKKLPPQREPLSAAEKKPAPKGSGQSVQSTAESDKDFFSGFISNGKNAFPLAAAREIAHTAPGKAYNPFLICGHSGTGKTHLLQALTDSFRHEGLRLYQAQASRFVADRLFPADRPEIFWQQRDVLLLDDVQDLAADEKAQQHLAACMDACTAGKQMVFTHAGPAAALKNLEERLRSRLESGLVVELLEPDLDVRLRYLQAHSKERRIPLKREQLLYLAQRCSQFRLLQGLLLKAQAFATMRGKELTQADLENIVRTGGADNTPGYREILNSVARTMHVQPEDILGDKRHHDLVLARQLAMFLCRQKLGLSYPELGRAFGGRDHSTVIHAIKKINNLLVSDKRVRQLMQELGNNAHLQVT